MNCLYCALRQIFPELKDNLLRNVNGKNKIKSNEVSNFLKNTYNFLTPNYQGSVMIAGYKSTTFIFHQWHHAFKHIRKKQ